MKKIYKHLDINQRINLKGNLVIEDNSEKVDYKTLLTNDCYEFDFYQTEGYGLINRGRNQVNGFYFA